MAVVLVAAVLTLALAPPADAHLAVGLASFAVFTALFAPLFSPVYAQTYVVNQAPALVYTEAARPAAPTPSVVHYPHGRYELRGDGVATAYTWVWIPNPPPPPPPPAAPGG
jgi:hypothetical protein